MKNTKPLLTALTATAALAAGSADADVLFGPQTYSGFDPPQNTIFPVTSLTNGDLGGNDTLVVTYSVTRENLLEGQNWLTVGFNAGGPNMFSFTSGGVFAALLRTHTNTGTTDSHGAFQATGTWAGGNDDGVDFDAQSPAEHAVRISIDGLSSGGFAGVKDITYEIDHYASSVVLADRTFTGTIDFGGTDVGLALDIRSFSDGAFVANNGTDADHVVNNFTVSAVPEPGSLALLGLGGLCMLKRRRRDASV
ncbi:MAG: PEP-CTERM sorting domain-containing protein [Phycisphaeraceae bacterium]